MNSTKKQTITIIGAGITGCFLAILLAKRGYSVDIYERLSYDEMLHGTENKSFNITFYGYAVQALKKLDLWKVIEPQVITLKGSLTQVTKYAPPIFSQFDDKTMPYYTVSRLKLLNTLLAQAMLYPQISFHFATSLLSINRQDKTILVENRQSHKVSNIVCEVVFGADGANSLVRGFLQQGQESQHSQEYATWNYKQITITKDVAMKLKLQSDITYSWTRQYAICVAFPTGDGSFAALLILPKDKKKGFAYLQSASSIKNFVTENFPQLLQALPSITTAIEKNPSGQFSMIHTSPWQYKNFLGLLGDSAHCFFPFFGQGVSAGIGDCLALIELIDKHGTNWEQVLLLYEKARKRHMDALGEVSKEGFLRYRRYKKADYGAIYDKLEFILHHLLPAYILPPLFIPISIDPNHTADYVEKHKKQRRVLNSIGASILVSIVTAVVSLYEKGEFLKRFMQNEQSV
jgi:kynurenine 3-monooxygenase